MYGAGEKIIIKTKKHNKDTRTLKHSTVFLLTLNRFHPISQIIPPENVKFSDIYRKYRNETFVWNGFHTFKTTFSTLTLCLNIQLRKNYLSILNFKNYVTWSQPIHVLVPTLYKKENMNAQFFILFGYVS